MRRNKSANLLHIRQRRSEIGLLEIACFLWDQRAKEILKMNEQFSVCALSFTIYGVGYSI
jgi:hypothetical protein